MEQEIIDIKNLPVPLWGKGIKEKLVKICEKNDIISIGIFGSFIRGKQRKKSDIDMLIKFKDGSEMTLLDVIRIEREFKKIFKKKVDLVTDGALSKYIKDEVLNSVKVIYEKR